MSNTRCWTFRFRGYDLIMFVFIFCLGAIVGSFLNVVSLRFNTGRSFVSGRSGCFSCGRQIRWYENIPIVSFVLLGGRCAGCKSKISWQYPLAELATASIFLLGFLKFQPLLNISLFSFIFAFVSFIFTSMFLILIFIYDLRHKIIPNEFVYPFILLTGVSMFVSGGYFNVPSLLQVLAGPLLSLPFFFLWVVSSGRWIGFADGKLAIGIGWWLGLVSGISAITLAFWMGAVWAIVLLILQKTNLFNFHQGITIKSEVPFGPFLISAFFIATFVHLDFFRFEGLLLLYGFNF